MGENEEKVHQTTLGDFTEIQPRVFVAESVNRSDLIIPATVSKTGQDQNLPVETDTVFYTNREVDALQQSLQKGTEQEDLSAYFNNLSVIASFTRAAEQNLLNSQTATAQGYEEDGGVGIIHGEFTDKSPDAASAFKLGSSGGLVQLPSTSTEDFFRNVFGIDPENLSVPAAYIQAFKSYVTAHELEHIEDKTRHEASTPVLHEEIKADIGALREHFNHDFNSFIMDMRAIQSMHMIYPNDDHATHIWAEEYGTVLPTAAEAGEIAAAPTKIYEHALARMETSIPRSEAEERLRDPGFRYAAFKTLGENGDFNEIPFANEFVDKYVAAAERRFNPDIIRDADLNQARELFAPNNQQQQQDVSHLPSRLVPAPTGPA